MIIMSQDESSPALTRLFQGEVIKLLTRNNDLLSGINVILKQNQVLLFQMNEYVEKIKSNSF
jgi:uncharacterized protein YwbE